MFVRERRRVLCHDIVVKAFGELLDEVDEVGVVGDEASELI